MANQVFSLGNLNWEVRSDSGRKEQGMKLTWCNNEQAAMRNSKEKFYRSWNNEEIEAVKLRKESKGKEQTS